MPASRDSLEASGAPVLGGVLVRPTSFPPPGPAIPEVRPLQGLAGRPDAVEATLPVDDGRRHVPEVTGQGLHDLRFRVRGNRHRMLGHAIKGKPLGDVIDPVVDVLPLMGRSEGAEVVLVSGGRGFPRPGGTIGPRASGVLGLGPFVLGALLARSWGGAVPSGLVGAGRLRPLTLGVGIPWVEGLDRKSTRLNSSHSQQSRMPSSA